MTGLSLIKFIISFITLALTIFFALIGFIGNKPAFKRRALFMFLATVVFIVVLTVIELIIYS